MIAEINNINITDKQISQSHRPRLISVSLQSWSMIIKQLTRSGKVKSVGKNAKVAYPDYTRRFKKGAEGTGAILFLEYSPGIGKLVEAMAENARLILECLSWFFRIYSKRKMIGFSFDVEMLHCYEYDLSKFFYSASG